MKNTKVFLIFMILIITPNILFMQSEKLLLTEGFENGLNGWYSYDNSNSGAKWDVVPSFIEGIDNQRTSFEIPHNGNFSAYCAGYGYDIQIYDITPSLLFPQYRNSMDTELMIPKSKLAGLSSANSARIRFNYNIPSIDGGKFTNNQDYFALYSVDSYGTHTEIWRTDEVTEDWLEIEFDLTPYLSNLSEISFYFHSDGSHVEQGVYIDDVEIYYKEKPFIDITSPSSYDQWVKGNTHKVEWDSNFDDDVSVELLKVGTSSKPVISYPSNPNTGEFNFPAPSSIEKGDYYIRVQSEGSSYATDNSDAFSIVDKVDAICISTLELDFKSVQIGQDYGRILVITNCGNTSANYSITSSGSSRFNSNVNSFNLGVNESEEVIITFSPSSTSSYNATFTVNSPSGSVNVNCEGYGVDYSSNIVITQSSGYDFSEIVIGGRRTVPFRILNRGNQTENIQMSIDGTNEFYFDDDNDKNLSLDAGRGIVIDIKLKPQSRGTKTAYLVARASSDGGEFECPLTGSGIELADMPTISPNGGNYYETQTISMNASSEFDIRYTSDGSEPNSKSKLYFNSFDLSNSSTIKAKSFWKNSPPYTHYSSTVSNSYQITGTLPVLIPNLKAQTYSSDIILMFLNVEEGSSVYYTLDGSDPTENSTLYSSDDGIQFTESKTVKAKAFKENWAPSPIFSGRYEIVKVLGKPFFSPSSDSLYIDSVDVYILSSDQNSIIKYTTDGTTPDNNSLVFEGQIKLFGTTTIKAKAYKEGWNESEIATSTFTFDLLELTPPILTSPSANSTISSSKPTFIWQDVTGATSYNLQIDDDSTFLSPNVHITTEFNEYTVTDSLAYNTFYWRVRSKNETENSVWSSIWSFTILDDKSGDGLVAYYPFNGNANDESGNGNNGTVNGSTLLTTDRFGNENSAYMFNGNGFIKIDPPLINKNISFSVSAWVNLNSISNTSTILFERSQNSNDYCGNSSAGNYGIQFSNNGKFSFETSTVDSNNNCFPTRIFANQTPTINEWYFLTAIYDKDNATMSYYVNGLLSTDTAVHSELRSWVDAATFIGKNPTVNNQNMVGKIDDIRVYDRILKDSEIEVLYIENGYNPGTTGLIAFYPFNGNANDESGNGNDGEVNGAILTADRFGNPNSAYSYDGVDDYIDCGLANNIDPMLSSFSISAWVKMTIKYNDSRNTLTFVSKKDGDSDYSGFGLYYNQTQNKVIFSINDEGDWSTHNEVIDSNSINIQDEEWNHVVCIADQAIKKMILYVNGEKTAESQITVTNYIRSSKGHLLLGGYHYNTSTFLDGFKGLLDDIRIYNLALTKDNVLQLYNNEIVEVKEDVLLNLKGYTLTQNYPNPFNPTSKISYSIPEQSQVTLKIFDVLGNDIKTLVNEEKTAGNYEIDFDASSFSSGIYFYRLQAGSFVETKKMLLLK